jgi:hypothetical protein
MQILQSQSLLHCDPTQKTEASSEEEENAFHAFLLSPQVVRTVKLRRMKWAEHVAHNRMIFDWKA